MTVAGSARSTVHRADIIPAVLGRTVAGIRRSIARVRSLSPAIHLDLMDGRFVRAKSITAAELSRLELPRGTTAHLMVERPMAWLGPCERAGIRSVVVHLGTVSVSDLRHIRRRNRVALAVNPGQSITGLTRLSRLVHGFHVMTVHPGRQGAPFLPRQVAVVRRLRRRFPRLPITVDGGLNAATIPAVAAAGARTFVIGSALQRSRHPSSTYRSLARSLRPVR